MAEVDFSNATIEIDPSATQSPVTYANVNLDRADLYSTNGAQITTGATMSRLINEQKQLMYLYQGTFTADGTAFVVHGVYGANNWAARWKVSNISFNSGDTYVFQINATLTCN